MLTICCVALIGVSCWLYTENKELEAELIEERETNRTLSSWLIEREENDLF